MGAPRGLKKLESESQVDGLFQRPLAIVYKHSTMCSVSSLALTEMEGFASSHPELELFQVDVLEARPISNYVEAKSGVRHQSPQLLLLRNGEVVWTASHFGVTAKALSAHLP